MKRIFPVICFVFFLFISMNHTSVFAKSESVIHTSTKGEEYDEAIVRALDNDTLCSMKKTYFTKYNVVIEKPTICYVVEENTIYGIYYQNTTSVLYSYHIGNKTYLETPVDATIYDIGYFDERLILVGTSKNDAILYRYQKNLMLINKKCFGGKGYESFIKIIPTVSKMILFGSKDAFSESSCFYNVGNINERKTFVVSIDQEDEIVDQLYINEQTQEETLQDVYYNNHTTYFLIKDSQDIYHQYQINENLEVELKSDLDEFNPTYILQIRNEKKGWISYIYTKGENLYVGTLNYTQNKGSVETIEIGKYPFFYSSKIQNGKLEVLLKESNQVKKLTIDEYHIDYLNDFYYNNQNDYNHLEDYKSTSHFQVSSYFQNFTFLYDETQNAYIDFQKSGTYQATYVATKQDKSKLYIQTNYIIPSFINIINEGVYPSNFKLLFTDVLYVDGEKKYNGDVITTPGKHLITHLVDGETYTYTIYIFDKGVATIHNHQETDFTLATPSTFYFQLQTKKLQANSAKVVKEVVVNHHPVLFTQKGSIIYIPITTTTSGTIETYTIDKIIYQEGTSEDLNIFFTVRTLYEPPIVEAGYENEEMTYAIKKGKYTLLDIVIRTYQNDQLVDDTHYPLDHFSYIILPTSSLIKIYVRYSLGNKTIEEIELARFLAHSTNQKGLSIHFEVENKEDDWAIKIKDTHQKKLEVEEAYLNEQNITPLYQKNENRIIIYISLISSSLIIVAIITILFVKKRRQKKNA